MQCSKDKGKRRTRQPENTPREDEEYGDYTIQDLQIKQRAVRREQEKLDVMLRAKNVLERNARILLRAPSA